MNYSDKFSHIVVYCGSNLGNTPAYRDAAYALGQAFAKHRITLVYGGGKVGLMGVLAGSIMAHGGASIGVIPQFLKDKEVAHQGLSELITTCDMATRKLKMIELGKAFIALPGGIGTYEELFEVISLAQLRQHNKPIGVLNIDGFFDPLLKLLEQTAETGFMPASNMNLVCVANTIDDLLHQMTSYQFVESQKWVKPKWLADDTDYIVPKFT
ncbi:LOG family protein [Moraxella cuniculi]|uniref:Cytokinin riboside 5'-monophosphate phosphoribohydrolase n=1 Tax=Moraxella cuniculi TaxID=34061 RepID=A0A3S4RLD6_9GAMM|nr:TIGR00730 family Rossman fold protein [Moraxella cuniculi]VEG13395.1 LOG family protein yvdD [Moraxella cuniculi]